MSLLQAVAPGSQRQDPPANRMTPMPVLVLVSVVRELLGRDSMELVEPLAHGSMELMDSPAPLLHALPDELRRRARWQPHCCDPEAEPENILYLLDSVETSICQPDPVCTLDGGTVHALALWAA